MEIVKLQGTDKKLYELVAPLVMNPAILRQNNYYPFKTSFKYTWYIAVENDAAIGFIPIKRELSGNYTIDNYYVRGDDAGILDRLLIAIIAEKEKGREFLATVHKRHVALFCQKGFSTCRQWKNYEKMRYCPQNIHVQAKCI
ncbi:MAG: hypothetical protein PUB21_07025 [Bacteroidales bacterium]|nr:hypothetical protein [Bacteroidales bacterium]